MAKNSVSQIKKLQAEAQVLLDDRGIATMDGTQLHPFKKFVHFWVLVGKSFVRNRCPVRASALAYTTLLALIPLLAVGLGVSTKLLQSSEEQKGELIQTLVDELAPQLGLVAASPEEKAAMRHKVAERFREAMPALLQSGGAQRTNLVNDVASSLVPAMKAEGSDKDVNAEYRQKLARRMLELMPRLVKSSEQRRDKLVGKLVDDVTMWNLRQNRGQDETSQKVVEEIKSFIANVHSGALGLSGTIALVFVAIGLLSTIEATFNDIWGVSRGRNWFVRIIHYWAAITLGPLVVILSMGLAVGSQFQVAQDFIEETPMIGGLLFKLIPFFVLSGSFMLLYQLMPNTKVHWKAALVGGAVAGLLWIANGNANALFASRVVSASKIYGSL